MPQTAKQPKDFSRRTFFVLAVLLVVVRLVLTRFQCVLLTPDQAPIDDTLLYEAAVSITNGQWLGAYNWLTLSKYSFFSVWLALLHTLHVPYLLGGQLLNIVAAGVTVWALAPLLRKNWLRLCMFAIFVFNPTVTAAAVQLRVYRDNITVALSLLFFAGFIGAALRWQQGSAKTLPFLLCGGIGLAASYLNREDGAWLLPFAAVATIIVCVLIVTQRHATKKLGRCAVQFVPYALLLCGVLAFCTMNYTVYGRFVVSDFTSKEFKDACGALMRVVPDESIEKIPVTKEVRLKLYDLVPEFAAIADRLEAPALLNDFGSVESGEYAAGGFYWALRRAVWESGYADTAAEACAYYEALAAKVNALCDNGALQAGRQRSATTMPIRTADVLPTLQGAVVNLGRLLLFVESEPSYQELSIGRPEVIASYEAFLGEKANMAAKEGTAESYYSPYQRVVYAGYRVLRIVFAVLQCAGFAAALWWLLGSVPVLWRSVRAKESFANLLPWLICLGLLLIVFLRCAMISFMFVTSFNPWVGKIMYLAGASPALLLFCLLGSVMLWQTVLKKENPIG